MSKLHAKIFFCIVSICNCISGCSGSATVMPSETHQKATALQTRGLRAAEKNNFQEAERLLTSALVVSTSIEDDPAKAVALINLARLYRLHNQLEKADVVLQKSLAIQLQDPEIIAEQYHEKALLELALHRFDKALADARQSLTTEQGSYKGMRRNLVSRCLYELGNKKDALVETMTALAENRSAGLREEEANSLRMAGILQRHDNNFVESTRLLNEALILDKDLGLSPKVARDLEELALTAGRNGSTKAESEYRERAREVHEASKSGLDKKLQTNELSMPEKH